MKSKYKSYFKSVFSNFSKIISREIRENNYFEFLEKFSRRTQSSSKALMGLRNFGKVGTYLIARNLPFFGQLGLIFQHFLGCNCCYFTCFVDCGYHNNQYNFVHNLHRRVPVYFHSYH
jgi:hypothetical protein